MEFLLVGVLANPLLSPRNRGITGRNDALSTVPRPRGDVRASGEPHGRHHRDVLVGPVRLLHHHGSRRGPVSRFPVDTADEARPRNRPTGIRGSDDRVHGGVLFSRHRPRDRPGNRRDRRREVPRLRPVTVAHAGTRAPARGHVVRGGTGSVLLRWPPHRCDSDETLRHASTVQLQPLTRGVLRHAHHHRLRIGEVRSPTGAGVHDASRASVPPFWSVSPGTCLRRCACSRGAFRGGFSTQSQSR